MENYAAVMKDIKKIDIESVNLHEPKEDEVLVKIDYVGICGSDVDFYEHGRIGDFIVKPPFILGHETAGTVIRVGKNVDGLKIGDRVALEPGVTCGKCIFCTSGKYNLCPDVAFMATPPYDGALQRYLSFPANMAFKLPDTVSTLEGALVEPLAVGLHAAKQGEVELGNSVVILGAGCIGLMTLLACKARGATQIIVTDVISNRLRFAKELGATHIIDSSKEDVLERILELTESQGVDAVFETAGAEPTIKQTPFLAKRGGTVVLVGLATKDAIEYNFMQVMTKELKIKSVFRYRNLYAVAIQAIANGNICIGEMVTHKYKFEDTKQGFDSVIKNKKDVVKAVIDLTSSDKGE